MTSTSQHTSSRPHPSPITQLLATSTPQHTNTPLALPLEILHNLRHQHSWADLTLHYIIPTPSRPSPTLHSLSFPLWTLPPALDNHETPILISGQPPRPVYIHPDQQNAALKASVNATNTATTTTSTPTPSTAQAPAPTPAVPREWVLPLSLDVHPSVSYLSAVFDALPAPVPASAPAAPAVPPAAAPAVGDPSHSVDGKRMLLGIKGPDGTIAYYVCLEGEVKPRQNG